MITSSFLLRTTSILGLSILKVLSLSLSSCEIFGRFVKQSSLTLSRYLRRYTEQEESVRSLEEAHAHQSRQWRVCSKNSIGFLQNLRLLILKKKVYISLLCRACSLFFCFAVQLSSSTPFFSSSCHHGNWYHNLSLNPQYQILQLR